MKKLSFKGDASTGKKRKRVDKDSSTAAAATKARSSAQSADGADEAEGWIDADCQADMSGPIFIAYAYDSPVSLGADTRGSLFTIPCEPSHALLNQVEPHDVRQVFIASRILGRSTTTAHSHSIDRLALKNGASSKYMSTDRFGELSCSKDAIGPAEEWILVPRPDGWSLQSAAYEKYLSIDKEGRIRCDAEEIGFCETLKVRIQARNRQKRLREDRAAAATSGNGAGKSLAASLSKKELEARCNKSLTMEEIDTLRQAQRDGSLSEAILDMRVKGRSDKFG